MLTEAQEQVILADWLNAHNILWFHPPNGGKRTLGQGRQLKREGMLSGVSDCIILSRAPKRPDARGVALELKRVRGGLVSKSQHAFLDACRLHGWLGYVARGADDAIRWLTELGFDHYLAPDPED